MDGILLSDSLLLVDDLNKLAASLIESESQKVSGSLSEIVLIESDPSTIIIPVEPAQQEVGGSSAEGLDISHHKPM